MAELIWEERWHPLRREWVLIAGHRASRPWAGESLAAATGSVPEYDPSCHFCPGNRRVSGITNPDYTSPFAFTNDHPPMGPGAPDPVPGVIPYGSRSARGLCKVITYHRRHDLTLAEMPVEDIAVVATAWQRETQDLGARPEVKSVLVFENKGKVVGVSNPHPHCQIYGANFVFQVLQLEVEAARMARAEEDRNVFEAMLMEEHRDGRRILHENDAFTAFIPFAARYAYEVMILTRRRAGSLTDFTPPDIHLLAACLKEVLVRYDNLWRMPLPYVMALHQAPTDGGHYPDFRFHIEIYPPLRAPHTLKYLAGPELGGGNIINPTCPEEKAAELRSLSGTHYKESP